VTPPLPLSIQWPHPFLSIQAQDVWLQLWLWCILERSPTAGQLSHGQFHQVNLSFCCYGNSSNQVVTVQIPCTSVNTHETNLSQDQLDIPSDCCPPRHSHPI